MYRTVTGNMTPYKPKESTDNIKQPKEKEIELPDPEDDTDD